MRNFNERLAKRANSLRPSPIRELLKYSALDGMISLGGGYPNSETFIFDDISFSFKGSQPSVSLNGEELIKASQYGPSRCYQPLEDVLTKWHKDKGGISLDEGQLAVLNGSQEGLFILAYLLVNEGDCIVLSEPTYPGAISAFSAFGASYCGVEIDENGMNTESLEKVLIERRRNGQMPPKMIYTIPNGHNPGGVTLSLERRKHLLKIASDNDLIVIEDDPYQLVKYTDKQITSLQELDTEGRVIRLDSFSKIFVPGFRIGYVSAQKEVVRYFELFKQSANLHTSTFNQSIIAAYLKEAGSDSLLSHIKTSCALYQKNRDAMVSASKEFLPQSVKYNIPDSGLFIWFELGDEVNCEAMHRRFTESHSVLLVPGSAFSTKNGCTNCMRASFSTVKEEEICKGIERFSEMICDYRVESRR